MSLARVFFNFFLRHVEKPQMARVEDPVDIRASFETKAKLIFRAPRGTQHARERIEGVPVRWVMARGVDRRTGPLLLYFHGGGYVFGSSLTHRGMLGRLSQIAGLPACLPDYRLAPEHPFPAAVEDALIVYRAVAYHPGGVILGGDSAGGGLALALLGEILQQGLPRPLGTFAFSPLTDMTFSGESFRANAQAEVLLPAARAREIAEMYLGRAAPDDPRASPLFADFKGAPPVWLTAGDTEILCDDTRRMARHLARLGVEVTEVIARDLPHVWPYFGIYMPEAMATLREVGAWITRLKPRSGDS